jgi:hypothetical protein
MEGVGGIVYVFGMEGIIFSNIFIFNRFSMDGRLDGPYNNNNNNNNNIKIL